MMNFIKDFPPISQIIHYLGAFFLTLSAFLGAHIFFKGNYLFSVPFAMILLLSFIGIVYLLQQLKKAQTNQKQMQFWEYLIFVIGYGLILGFTSLYFLTHSININYTQKQNIQANTLQYLNECNKLVISYEKYVDSLKSRWATELDNSFLPSTSRQQRDAFFSKYNIFPFKSSNWNESKNQTTSIYVLAFKTKLLDDFHFKKDSILTYYDNNKNTFENWNYVKIPSSYFKIQENIKTWVIETENLSLNQLRSKESPFQYQNSNLILDDISNPRDFFHYTKWPMTLIIFFLLHLFILWPYIFGARSGQNVIDGNSGDKTGFEM